MGQKVRAKFQVQGVKKTSWGGTVIELQPQYDTSIPEDQRFAKATPSGLISLTIDNPLAVDFLQLGKFFYVDFTEVPAAMVAGG